VEAWALGAGSPGWKRVSKKCRIRECTAPDKGNCLNRKTYQALHVADEQTVEDLAGFIGVADILEGLGAVLATDIEEDFLTTAAGGLLAFRSSHSIPGKK
jgi:hypothetical protein